VIVCLGGTTDDVPKSVGSVICPDTSVGSPCEEEGTSCDWGTIEEEKVLLGSGMLDEVERMVLSSVAFAGSLCFSDPFS
jgi:hypothetical protein